MPQTPHVERHFTGSATVRDIVIGMSDGLTVPFALAAGLSGAVDNTSIIVTAGLAEVAAGSIAMGLGGYLAGRSDAEHYDAERVREETEVREKAKVEAEKQRAEKRTTEDKEFLRQALEERKVVAAAISPQLLSHYERIRKRWHGVVIADATDGRCAACQMKLRPQYFQELRKADKLYFCESCGRILYYNPPVNLEHEIHSKA